MPRYTDQLGLVITTSSAAAAACYADGVELLISSSPRRRYAMLQAAVGADPSFGVALAALALGTAGQPGADGATLEALSASAARIVFRHPPGAPAHRDRGHCRYEATPTRPRPRLRAPARVPRRRPRRATSSELNLSARADVA